MTDIVSFNSLMLKAMQDLLVQWPDPKLPGKLHYRFKDYKLPLSVTPHEAYILFAIARTVRPVKIYEAGTGTGYSTAFMSAGWPEAQVVTADNFSEGGVGPIIGPLTVVDLWHRLELHNIELKVGDISANAEPCELLFLDGTGKGRVPGNIKKGARLVVDHDEKASQHRKYYVRLNTPCYLSLHSDDAELLTACEIASRVFLA